MRWFKNLSRKLVFRIIWTVKDDSIWEDEESGGIDDEIQIVENVEENAISEKATVHPYDDELDDVAVDFLFEEVSEPEEMTDDDSDFSP